MHDDPLVQKVKGKVQKAVGDIQAHTGSELKGAVNKVKGEFNDTVGQARIDNTDRKAEKDDIVDDTIL